MSFDPLKLSCEQEGKFSQEHAPGNQLSNIFSGLLSHRVSHLDQHSSMSDTVTYDQSSETRNGIEKTGDTSTE